MVMAGDQVSTQRLSTQRVKVRTADLIKAVEAKKKKLESEAGRQDKNYDKALTAYETAAIKALNALLVKAAGGDVPRPTYNGDRSFSVTVGVQCPQKVKTGVTTQLEKDLSLLKLSADEFIMVATDSQWGQYL
jgi:hypothetical protein